MRNVNAHKGQREDVALALVKSRLTSIGAHEAAKRRPEGVERRLKPEDTVAEPRWKRVTWVVRTVGGGGRRGILRLLNRNIVYRARALGAANRPSEEMRTHLGRPRAWPPSRESVPQRSQGGAQ